MIFIITSMKAWMIFKSSDLSVENYPLELSELPKPEPKSGEVLIKISTCAVCHTEIDEIEGRTPPESFPVIPGHQVVGIIEKSNTTRKDISIGDRVGVAWIYTACGTCDLCLSGQENLCQNFRATGRDVHGGYAEYMVADENYVYKIPSIFSDIEAAPLLCAGAIGYRSLSLCNIKDGDALALTGFGASAHLVLKLGHYIFPHSDIFVFARSEKERKFALELGAKWAGDTTERPPVLMNAIIDTTPVWKPILYALEFLKPGGRLVINAIRKENLDQEMLTELDYSKHLWMEKEIKSVANVTRKDVENFLDLAAKIPIKPNTEIYSFNRANEAILDIKNRKIKGAKVLLMQ
jgi:propanol-preferring alcohol dehydrogenase